MARILILQESQGQKKALQISLQPHHELIFVDSPEEALAVLEGDHFDLIISRVHLDRSSAFDFLIGVRKNPALAKIPFICYSGRLNERARSLDRVLEKAARLCGADKYISLAAYCTDNVCDFQALRLEIEQALTSPS